MPRASVLKDVGIEKTVRVAQMAGIFDVSLKAKSEFKIDAEIPIEGKNWNIGVIVGPSGSGKTTIARELWPRDYVGAFSWSKEKSVLDDFPARMGVRDIVATLCSVGFSSPPSWVRPFACLSNGEQFRVTLARALAESSSLIVMDEYSSVVDRVVAKVCSAAVVKTIRRLKKQFVAVTCHYDVIDWLDPEWTYDVSSGKFVWRLLRGRPKIRLEVRPVPKGEWVRFARHHYMTASLSHSAKCFCAYVDGMPAAFLGVIMLPLKDNRAILREHRVVTLPDYQGVGIGTALSNFVGSLVRACGYRYTCVTSHPSMIASKLHDAKNWRMVRSPSFVSNSGANARIKKYCSARRMTASFVYVGPPDARSAREFMPWLMQRRKMIQV